MEDGPLRPDGLQLDEDRDFQERFWRVERIAWAVFALVLVAALAGLTGGGGPLSEGQRRAEAGQVRYPAIARWTATDTLSIGFATAGTVDVILGPSFLETFEIQSIQPEPAASYTTPDGLRLEFSVAGEGAEPVSLRIKPLVAGPVRYDIRVGEAEPMTFWTLIMP